MTNKSLLFSTLENKLQALHVDVGDLAAFLGSQPIPFRWAIRDYDAGETVFIPRALLNVFDYVMSSPAVTRDSVFRFCRALCDSMSLNDLTEGVRELRFDDGHVAYSATRRLVVDLKACGLPFCQSPLVGIRFAIVADSKRGRDCIYVAFPRLIPVWPLTTQVDFADVHDFGALFAEAVQRVTSSNLHKGLKHAPLLPGSALDLDTEADFFKHCFSVSSCRQVTTVTGAGSQPDTVRGWLAYSTGRFGHVIREKFTADQLCDHLATICSASLALIVAELYDRELSEQDAYELLAQGVANV